jgi:hypothetical protein
MSLHINKGPRQVYIGQTRRRGARKFRTVTGRCASAHAAMKRLAGKCEYHSRVLSVAADPMEDYYGPTVVYEIKRVGKGLGV